MADFFISYNRADRAWAEWIAWQLEAAGYTTIIQAWDFRPGGNFVQEMQRAAAQSKRTLAVLSPDYLNARFTQSEWAAAFAQDPTGEERRLVPVRVRECKPEGLLPQIITIDLIGQEETAARAALLAGVQGGRVRPESPPNFPGRTPPATQPHFPGPTAVPPEARPALQVILLYKRSAKSDEHVLGLLERELAARGHAVFVDPHPTIGAEWMQGIERRMRERDAVIALISEAGLHSERLEYEIKAAHAASQAQGGKPRLLPVRVGYTGPLPPTLALLLDPLPSVLWQTPGDDPRLIAEVVRALENPAPPPRDQLEAVGGVVPLDSKFYIVRPADADFGRAITRRDSIVLVKGARQMGKTSLLARALQQAREAKARVVLTDFQALSGAEMADVGAFYRALCRAFKRQLDLDVSIRDVWDEDAGPGENFEDFLRREVLGKSEQPVVWGLDEVDRLFTCPFGSEVFGLFRSWHNARALHPSAPWFRLTLAIAYATEAHLFITDPNQSPFNVGTRLTLEDFTEEQVAELNRRYGGPLRTPEERDRFYALVGGHPYLVRRGLYEMVDRGLDLAALEGRAIDDEGPFGDHLRRITSMLDKNPVLLRAVHGYLSGEARLSAEYFYRLRSAGVMVGQAADQVRPRCQLYCAYLTRYLL